MFGFLILPVIAFGLGMATPEGVAHGGFFGTGLWYKETILWGVVFSLSCLFAAAYMTMATNNPMEIENGEHRKYTKWRNQSLFHSFVYCPLMVFVQ